MMIDDGKEATFWFRFIARNVYDEDLLFHDRSIHFNTTTIKFSVNQNDESGWKGRQLDIGAQRAPRLLV